MEGILTGLAIGFSIGLFFLGYVILELVTSWKVFEKYGVSGWKGLIPFYSKYIEYGKVWVAAAGLVAIAIEIAQLFISGDNPDIPGWLPTSLGVAAFLLRVFLSSKKSKAFGKGFGMTLLLLICPFIANLILGLGDAKYQGPQGADL